MFWSLTAAQSQIVWSMKGPDMAIPLRLATSPDDYRKLGLKSGEIDASEGRLHVDGSPGTLEWWWMLAEVAEGFVVVGFLTAPNFRAELGLRPVAVLNVVLSNGALIDKSVDFAAEGFQSSSGGPEDIRVGENYFRYLGENSYRAHFETDGISADIDLTQTLTPWRPEAGHVIFGEDDENYFGLTVVPKGEVHVVVRGEDLDIDSRGVGYIDRGWMNKPLAEFLHNWNWLRADFDEYTVVAIYMTFEEKYGYPEIPFFMVYRGDQLLAGGPGTQNFDHITYTTGQKQVDGYTGKPVLTSFTYDYHDGDTRFVLSIHDAVEVSHVRIADVLSGTDEQKSRASSFRGAEMRFVGPAEFTHYEANQIVGDVHKAAAAVYEIQYMGQPR